MTLSPSTYAGTSSQGHSQSKRLRAAWEWEDMEWSATLHPRWTAFACRFEDPYHKAGRFRQLSQCLGQWHPAESRGRRSLSTADPVNSTRHQGGRFVWLLCVLLRVVVCALMIRFKSFHKAENQKVRSCCCLCKVVNSVERGSLGRTSLESVPRPRHAL